MTWPGDSDKIKIKVTLPREPKVVTSIPIPNFELTVGEIEIGSDMFMFMHSNIGRDQ